MTAPVGPPARKDPRRVSNVPLLPPDERSRAALAWSVCVAGGRFALQVCANCGAVLYPPRDACPKCLGIDLEWRDISPLGRVLAETRLATSVSLYFRARMPWRVGLVSLDAGPSLITHLHDDCRVDARVRMLARLDRSGHAVLLALPAEAAPDMETDPHYRELTCSPKYRRILLTDGRHPAALHLARGLVEAGATTVFVGFPSGARALPLRRRLEQLTGIEIVPLDVTDSRSVEEAAGSIGAKVDILIHTGDHKRPGRLLERRGIVTAREEMETNYFGPLRLAQSFGPVMRSRGGDGVNSAIAWVNIISVYALSNWPEFASYHASHAAALSLSQSLRADLHSGGIRVINAFTGPIDDEWNQAVPPPKVTPGQIARAVLDALAVGTEDVYVGDVAKEVAARWNENPKVLEFELGGR